MSIDFACPSCGKRFTVPAESAGRKGVCKGCGESLTVPTAEIDEDEYGVASVGYGLVESEPAAVEPDAESVFSRSARNVSERPPSIGRKSSGKRRSSRVEAEPFPSRYRNVLIGIPIAITVALVVVAMILPHGVAIAAASLAAIGSVILLIGSCVSIYVAFSEDGMYGWLCLLFPFYMAYYIISRWDDMWPWFATMTVGAVMITLAGWIAETAAADAVPDPAEASRPASERLIPLITFRTLAEHPSRA